MVRPFSVLGVVVAGLLSFAGVAAGAEITLTYANFPPATTFPCVQMERWKDEVQKRTGGAVEVKTFPGGTLLGAKNMLKGVEDGVADIGCFAMSYQPGRFPVSEAVDQPLGFGSARVASLTLFDLLAKRNPKEFSSVKVITAFTCAPTNFMLNKDTATLAELKGATLRVSGTTVDAAKLLGINPDAMPMSEVPDALQKGRVKGVVSSLEVLKDMSFASYCPFVLKADVNVVTFAVVMNKDRWEALDPKVQKVINDLAREQAEWTGKYADDHVLASIAWAKEKHGLTIKELSDAEKAQLTQTLQPMLEEYAKRVAAKGIDGKQVLADVRAIKAGLEK